MKPPHPPTNKRTTKSFTSLFIPLSEKEKSKNI